MSKVGNTANSGTETVGLPESAVMPRHSDAFNKLWARSYTCTGKEANCKMIGSNCLCCSSGSHPTAQATSSPAPEVAHAPFHDPVSYPNYLFSPVPSRLKIDNLRKILMVFQLEAVRAQVAFYQRMTSLFGPLKDFLCTLPKARGV